MLDYQIIGLTKSGDTETLCETDSYASAQHYADTFALHNPKRHDYDEIEIMTSDGYVEYQIDMEDFT